MRTGFEAPPHGRVAGEGEAGVLEPSRTGSEPRPVPGIGVTVGALLRKELLVELRTLESVPAMSLFAVTTFVVFHFALNRNTVDGDLAAGILWVTLLFAAILGINRLFVADADQGGFDAFLLAPVNRTAMLLAKALALLAYLAVLELVAVPAFALLLLGPSLGQAFPDLLVVLVLGDLGVAVIGTLVAALAVRTRARDLLAAAHATSSPARWLLTLGLYDLVFGLIAFALFDFLLED
jgi:heme exporter protein B